MTDLKSLLTKEKNIMLGTKGTMRNIKMGKTKKVFLASDCLESTKKDIIKYAKLAGAEVEQLDMPSSEIGMICKKPFSISVLSY